MGRLADAFSDGRFAPPATAQSIAKAEDELGRRLPVELRTLYEESDGFREPKGNTPHLHPLDKLVAYTRFMWGELQASAPGVTFPDFSPFLFFGSNAVGGWWGIRTCAPHDVIYWHHHMLDEGGYEAVEAGIVEAYLHDFSLYDLVEQSNRAEP